jgi:hypothetical protein
VIFAYLAETFNGPSYLKNILGLLVLLFIANSIFLMLGANAFLLRNASKAKEGASAKSSPLVVALAGLVFLMPIVGLVHVAHYPDYAEYKDRMAYLKTTQDKHVEFRIGVAAPAEGLIEGIVRESGLTVYFESEAFLTQAEITNAATYLNEGRAAIGLDVSKQGRAQLSKASLENPDKLIVLIFDGKPALAVKIGQNTLDTEQLFFPISDRWWQSDVSPYLKGRADMQNEHSSYIGWLIHNF